MLKLKLFTATLVIGLLSTACGGADPLEGEAVRVAVQSGQFCDEAYSDIWGDFGPDAMTPDNAQDFAASIQRVLRTLPDDAPRDLRRVYETFEEIAILSIDLPILDAADMDENVRSRYEDILAAVEELDGFDQDVVASYVASTCPAQFASRGFLTTGSAGPTQGAGSETGQAQAASPTSAPTVEPTPEPIPLVTTDLAIELNVGRFDGTDIELFGVQATNADPESLLAGDPVIDPNGENWLLVHLGLTNTFATQARFAQGALLLIGPDGRPVAETQRLDDRGRDEAFRTIDARAFDEGFVVFPTGDLVDDLSDWVLVIDQDDGVPEMLPLTTTYTNEYPYELATGGSGIIRQEAANDFGGCSVPIGEWEAEVTEAVVHVDPLSGSGIRVPSGERWMTVRLFATNVGPLKGNVYCDVGAQLGGNMDLRLAVDGRSTGHIGSHGYSTTQIATGESTTMKAQFRIDASATTLALISGPDNEVLVEWQVDIPLILDR